jgi:hypothetical protein
MGAHGSLQLPRFAVGKDGVARVTEVSDRLSCRHQFEQKLKALSSHFGPHEINAGQISARPIETVDKAYPDWIGSLHKNDRDRLGCRFGCKRTLCALQYNDHGYLIASQFGSKGRQLIVSALCPPVCDGDVLALDVTGFARP